LLVFKYEPQNLNHTFEETQHIQAAQSRQQILFCMFS